MAAQRNPRFGFSTGQRQPGNVPSLKFSASPSRLFSSQTSVPAITDTQSAMRDNGDGLSMEARYANPIQGLGIWKLSLSFLESTSNSFVLNGLREIVFWGGVQTPFN